MAQSRKPITENLGVNFESLPFSESNKDITMKSRSEVVDWLQLFNNYVPRIATSHITNNETNTYNVIGTGVDTLIPAVSGVGVGPHAGYTRISNFTMDNPIGGFTMDTEVIPGVSYTGDEIIIPADGRYDASGWLTFRHTANGATAAVVFGLEFPSEPGVIYFSDRPTGQASPNLSKLNLINGEGSFDAVAGTKLTVWGATDTSGTVTVPNATLKIQWAAPKFTAP